MKKFIPKVLGFSSLLILVFSIGLFLPVTPRASESLLFSRIPKEELLKTVSNPRIIFIGGSNLSFGLNSQMILDSLGLNPINTGAHASLGLIFMMDDALPYIKSGDIVVIAAEYSHFFGNFAYGGEELLRTIFDVKPSDFGMLRFKQIMNLLPYLPKYSLSKLNPVEYFTVENSDIYSVHSFNQYGDTYTHWVLPQKPFEPYGKITDPFNPSVVEELLKFKAKIEAQGATLLITYPGLQAQSFKNSLTQINQVATALQENHFSILGAPERYMMEDSLLFNSPYHLTKQGVDYRTQLFIEDFRHGPLRKK